MSHINIQHTETKMWRCWSTYIDDWVSDWMSETDYKEYLIQEAADSMREDLEHFGIRTTKFRTYNDCVYDLAFKQMCEQCPDRFEKCDECDKNITVEAYIEQGDNYLNLDIFKEN